MCEGSTPLNWLGTQGTLGVGRKDQQLVPLQLRCFTVGPLLPSWDTCAERNFFHQQASKRFHINVWN